ncbi:hypothetical protein O3M35_003593 [Rhynocoris fuscipes]|uniref:NADH dehydrogenase subunit 2 n=1 Tax=Rhynocoris fuscipes TaxID=488301 RepID=A0AAW1CKN5_9HEMI
MILLPLILISCRLQSICFTIIVTHQLLLNLEICCSIVSSIKTIFTINPYSCTITLTIIDRVTLNIGLIPIWYIQINYSPIDINYMLPYFISESLVISAKWIYGKENIVMALSSLIGKRNGIYSYYLLAKIGSNLNFPVNENYKCVKA